MNLVFAAGYLYLSVYLETDPMAYGPVGCYITPYIEAVGYWLSPWLQVNHTIFHEIREVGG